MSVFHSVLIDSVEILVNPEHVYSDRLISLQLDFMVNPAEVQEIRNKLRMMKFPQDEILNTVHEQKQANETIRTEINEYEAQIAKINHSIEKYKTDEELQQQT